ncbi:CPBP family intramembrane glutamic endopeptidase [Brunnivagina elsteri]|uniref:CPBP family intramembrane metalloprotease domain-containing protein n=1 Tax=Brunnivagina elsteri CCALA 953 TaxID=987040 RepID=A0A2A2T9Q3_9CYAN|nr:CPBP family intramembrane glutamic endopeptidase [Calothrix elsteri]PAX45754.1 CPBP family intramembrane metalloprotease domain-containing protein [Calothrix elsteri CCALA 953]
MSQNYLEIAQQGKNNWWRYLLGIILIFFMWMIVGSIATIVFVGVVFANRGLPFSEIERQFDTFVKSASLDSFIAINLQFIFFLIGILVAVKLLHNRKILSLVSAESKINFKRFFAGFGVWFLLQGILIAIALISEPQNYKFTFNPAQWFPLLIAALILTPIQTSSEELFFRGYLIQAFSRITKNKYVIIIITGLLFMFPHLLNPEVQRGAVLMAMYYFSFGALAAFLTLKDNRLELALGVHAANNLTLVIINTEDSVIPTPAIWTVKQTGSPGIDLVVFLIQSAIFYYIFFGRTKKIE